jgi:hypothetical protein
MFNRFCPSLKARAQLKERVDLSKFNGNEERYVIPMHRKSFWTDKWMQEPRKNFCRLQVQHYDPRGSAQYKKDWGTFKRKRGLTLCYNCRRSGHLAKECPEVGPICLCCKVVGHKVEDCPRIIAKVEGRDIRQENYEKSQETKGMLESHKEKRSEEVQTMLLQLEEMMDVHKDVSLPEILKEKQRISARIKDFDIDCIVLDEETQVNIMTEETWEVLGKPTVVPSLGRIGLFKGKMITLCGRVTIVPIIVHGTSTEEEFEVIRFVEDNAPFPLLLGKTWIEKDQIRRKAEEEATEKKKKELRDFIARKIDQLREEREDKSKQQRKVTTQEGHKEKELAIKVERMQEGLKDLSIQERSVPTQEVLRKGILTSEPLRVPQQCEATTLGEDKNKNGKRIPETVKETQITGKKARKLNKKKAKLEKLQEVKETRWKTSQTGTSQEAGSQGLNLAGTTGPRRFGLRPGEVI